MPRHSSSMSPLKLALAAKADVRLWSDVLDGLGRDPSHERDVAFDELDKAQARHRRIITEEWTLRCMARGYLPGNAPKSYENDASLATHEAA